MKLLLTLFFLMACSGEAAPPLPPGGTVEIDSEGEVYEDIEPPPQGNLPFGYYERQCQWDACGGPLPNSVNPLENPVR